jgi:hypothetical protein
MYTGNLSRYKTASFRGIPFLYSDVSEKGGRKSAVFEYPNKNTRYVEDLGLLQRAYNMRITLTNKNEDYSTVKRRIVAALDTPGPGFLVHPIDGSVLVFAQPYELKESISHAGTLEIVVTFLEVGASSPITAQNYPSSYILQKISSTQATINSDFSDLWGASVSYYGNASYNADLLNDAYDFFYMAKDTIPIEGSDYIAYMQQLDIFKIDLYRNAYAKNGAQLANQITNIFNAASALTTTTTYNLQLFKYYLTFTIDPITSNSLYFDERLKSNVSLIQTMRANAFLLYLYFVTINNYPLETDIINEITYITDILEIITVDNMWINVLQESNNILSPELISTIQDLFQQAITYLYSQINSAATIFNQNVNNQSLLSLVFQHYGDLNYYDTIYNLNSLVNANNLTGALKLLQYENSN